jgi:hypothetical protein
VGFPHEDYELAPVKRVGRRRVANQKQKTGKEKTNQYQPMAASFVV